MSDISISQARRNDVRNLFQPGQSSVFRLVSGQKLNAEGMVQLRLAPNDPRNCIESNGRLCMVKLEKLLFSLLQGWAEHSVQHSQPCR